MHTQNPEKGSETGGTAVNSIRSNKNKVCEPSKGTESIGKHGGETGR